MWYNTSQLSLLLKECAVIRALYRKKQNVILTCWFTLNACWGMSFECSLPFPHLQKTNYIFVKVNTIWLKVFVHISRCPKQLNPLRNIRECEAAFFFLLGSSGNQSYRTKGGFVFLHTSPKVSLMWYRLWNDFVLMDSSAALLVS